MEFYHQALSRIGVFGSGRIPDLSLLESADTIIDYLAHGVFTPSHYSWNCTGFGSFLEGLCQYSLFGDCSPGDWLARLGWCGVGATSAKLDHFGTRYRHKFA